MSSGPGGRSHTLAENKRRQKQQDKLAKREARRKEKQEREAQANISSVRKEEHL